MGIITNQGLTPVMQMMKEAGFSSVEVKELEHDFINYYYIVNK